jgi:hypothetical protein
VSASKRVRVCRTTNHDHDGAVTLTACNSPHLPRRPDPAAQDLVERRCLRRSGSGHDYRHRSWLSWVPAYSRR